MNALREMFARARIAVTTTTSGLAFELLVWVVFLLFLWNVI